MSLETSTSNAAAPRDGREPLEYPNRESGLSDAASRYEEKDLEKALPSNASEDTQDQKDESDSPSPAPAQEPDPNLVVFDGPDDPGNPKNWSMQRRAIITVAMALMTFVVTFASSVFAVAIQPVSEEYNVSTVVATLGVSLFLFGFVLGPVVFGPASEVFGRRVPLHSGYVVFAIFQIPVAVAQNIETIMLGRFISGFAASAPLAVVGGALADLWDPVERAYAICAFATGAFCGPVAGPIIGDFVTQSYLGWRWTAWITLIMAALFGIIGLWIIPETSAARILQIRAGRLRHETKNWALHAKADENKITAQTVVTVYLVRPFVMLVQEPILALITAYMSVLYGILYLLFEAYPISFHEDRGWALGVSSLPFCAFIIGVLFATGTMAISTATNFKRAYIKHGKAIPEERLPPMIIGAVILPISLFWFGWTSFPSISWVPQVIATAFLGFSCLITFWEGMSYIIDCYGFYSNSAIAVNTFIRSIAGAVFPLFAPAMFHNLGVPWASSVLGFIMVVFLPAPVLFYIYGARIRARSRFTPTG